MVSNFKLLTENPGESWTGLLGSSRSALTFYDQLPITVNPIPFSFLAWICVQLPAAKFRNQKDLIAILLKAWIGITWACALNG